MTRSGNRTLGFTGDVMLGRGVERLRRGDPPSVWGDLLGRLRALDGLFVNLECPLSTRGEQWTRTHRPFHFRADPEWAVPALEAAGVDCATLANNHALDYGPLALADTLDALSGAEIARVGAGPDRETAWTPVSVPVSGLDVAVVAFTDNTQEYAADRDSPGVAHAPIDVDDDRTRRRAGNALAAARERDPDLLVASLHWGPNMEAYPPEEFRRFARWLVDRGVDLLHGHSAHVLQGVEVYDGTPIVYDAGDFVDDYAVDEELRNDRSALFEARIDGGDVAELRALPVEIDRCAVRRAEGATADWIRERLRERSAPFETDFERDGAALVVRVNA